MAVVTYRGRASRIRIVDGSVLERLVPAEVPNDIARALSPLEFDVVLPTRRPPARPQTTKPPARAKRARAPKKES